MSELKPCFCGGEAHLKAQHWDDGSHDWWVECAACGAEGMHCDDGQCAIDAWNTRHAKTCRNIDDDYDSYFECSECGCHVLCEFYGSGYGEPRFCPGCGRKVER